MIDADELALLEEAAADKSVILNVAVTGCAFSCCGKGWVRRDGYEQPYTGYVDNLHLPEGEAAGTFMLYAVGIGTLSYVVAIRFAEVALIERSPGW